MQPVSGELIRVGHGKPWKNWRVSRSRIRRWSGIESSSPAGLTHRDFADESVDRELIRKQNVGSCRLRKKIPVGAAIAPWEPWQI